MPRAALPIAIAVMLVFEFRKEVPRRRFGSEQELEPTIYSGKITGLHTPDGIGHHFRCGRDKNAARNDTASVPDRPVKVIGKSKVTEGAAPQHGSVHWLAHLLRIMRSRSCEFAGGRVTVRADHRASARKILVRYQFQFAMTPS